jgi:hypothetical protein
MIERLLSLKRLPTGSLFSFISDRAVRKVQFAEQIGALICWYNQDLLNGAISK